MAAPTKWAVGLEDIENACCDENLLRRALIDFTTEFARHIVHDKTPRQAIAELDSWRYWLETLGRKRT